MGYKILISHPFGNANVKQTALAFSDADMLAEYWTSISWDEKNWLNRFLPTSIKNELMRRSLPAGVIKSVKHFPFYEIARLIAIRLGACKMTSSGNGVISALSCHVRLDERVAKRIAQRQKFDAVYLYDHCSLSSFKAAHEIRAQCIYELPTGYWKLLKKITNEECDSWPEWRMTAPSTTFSEEIYRRKDQELLLADHIVVPSQFSKDSLQLLPAITANISVVPYGAPTPLHGRVVNFAPTKKLKVLYVGNLGILKGIPYLLDAAAELENSVELTLIGSLVGECVPLQIALRKHRWIPTLPNSEVLKEMEMHDVFVFPSLFDGFGLVILEALSRGLPVITTVNTGGPDILEEGVDGFIVPIRSTNAIVEKLKLLSVNRELLAQMSNAALKKASECSWKFFRENISNVIENVSTHNNKS